MKSGKLSQFKRRHLRMLPGDIPKHDKIELLHSKPSELPGRMAGGHMIQTAAQSKAYRNDFARGANRKLRHEAAKNVRAIREDDGL